MLDDIVMIVLFSISPEPRAVTGKLDAEREKEKASEQTSARIFAHLYRLLSPRPF